MPTIGDYDKVPVMLLDPSCLEHGIRVEERIPALSIYIQSGDLRGSACDSCIYTAKSKDSARLAELLQCLWEERGSSGLLSKRLISLMIGCGILLEDVDSGLVTGAAYDLRLGDEYYRGGNVHVLTEMRPFVTIEPYDYAIVKSKETMNFPRDVVGRFDLPVSLFVRGIVLSNSTQVDPGFCGPLFCLLFNTSNASVVLKRGQHCATLEFHKMSEPTVQYSGEHQNQNIGHYLPANVIQGGINELKKEFERVKQENRMLQTTLLGLMSLTLAIIAVLIVLR
jgi:deoxycytidine triphosphate deaminase